MGFFFCVVALRLFLFHIRFFLFMWSEVFTVFSNNSSVFYVFGYFSFFRWHFVISQLAVLMTFPLNQRDEIKNDWWNGNDPSHHPKSKRLSRTWAHLIFDLRKKVENHSFFVCMWEHKKNSLINGFNILYMLRRLLCVLLSLQCIVDKFSVENAYWLCQIEYLHYWAYIWLGLIVCLIWTSFDLLKTKRAQ